ncbi:MAG: tol-pal system-associated acyl-CoA thioesterase [Zoogloeaceae bacterium]|nr:tol-pal system-associated acyl-CoA thioesterase [Zoogloeaceae bacterium]
MTKRRSIQPPRSSEAFSLPVRVYYEDTDAAGLVYYANYLRFCERARTEWLRTLGFAQHALMADKGIAFVVRSVEARYRTPAKLDDLLVVVSQISRLGGASLEFDQKIHRTQELIFDARITIACIDIAGQRPAPLPPELRTRLHNPTPS